jgi:hypothetical protein
MNRQHIGSALVIWCALLVYGGAALVAVALVVFSVLERL